MILENAPQNIRLAGDVKAGCVFRYLKSFYISIASMIDDIKGINLETGIIVEIDPTASVETFPKAKVVF